MLTAIGTAVLVATASVVQAQTDAPAAVADTPAMAGGSVQERYSRGEAELRTGNLAAAERTFASLQTELAGRPQSPNLALTRLALAVVLDRLGRSDEAMPLLDAALASPAIERPALSGNRYDGLLLRATLSEQMLSDGPAAADYRTAARIAADPADKARALLGAARVGMFRDPDQALAEIDEALRIADALPTTNRDTRAALLSLKGRAALNRGDTAGARTLLADAIRQAGGLTQSRVSFTEIGIRSDMALTQLRLGNADEAKRYLAYTGAGRATTSMPLPAEVAVPICGEEDIGPDDTAVIQFDIADDGSTTRVAPIFSSRSDGSVWAFARSVANWRFAEAGLADLPDYYRKGTRVQLRCRAQPDRPGRLLLVTGPTDEWLGEAEMRTLANLDADSLRARLAAPGLTERDRIRTLVALTGKPEHNASQSLVTFDEILSSLEAGDAPPAVWMSMALRRANITTASSARRREAQRIRQLSQLASAPLVVGSPQYRALVRRELALAYAAIDDPANARSVLQAVADDNAIDPRDPVRIGALIDLANLEARAGRVTEAQAAYDRTGLTAQQCALLDSPPQVRDIGLSFRDFPDEALRWGFEGWVTVEHDVMPDGRAASIRTIASYPPEVFSAASERGFGRARFDATYRPGGAPGCTGATKRISFQIP